MIFLGLGTNVGNRLQNLRVALEKIKHISKLTVINVSPVYESEAILPENCQNIEWQQPYLNAVISCKTKLEPQELYKKTKQIEQEMGRPKSYAKWSPRLIDIDLLAWDNLYIDDPILYIPHKDICKRPFVMLPLSDLDPSWVCCDSKSNYFGKTAQEIIELLGWERFNGTAPLHTKQIAARIDFPQLVGILNITTDSFSDGGKFVAIDAALKQAQYLFDSGAEVIDIGAESTRPNQQQVLSSQDEWLRLGPVLKEVLQLWHGKRIYKPLISIDTRHFDIAEKSIELGVDWINDVTGFNDYNMLNTVKDADVKLVFMHSLSCPPQKNLTLPPNTDPIKELIEWSNKKIAQFAAANINKDRLIFDPGIGFGKTNQQNLEIIKRACELHQTSLPLLIGHSRKSFFMPLTNTPANDRDIETVIVSNYLAAHNVNYLRIHNVALHARAFKIKASLGIESYA